MTEIKFTPAQNQWLEVTWTDVVQAPDVVTPAVDAVLDEEGTEVTPAQPERTTPGAITRTELKHTSYHPTQLALLQADAEKMGTDLTEHESMLTEWEASYVAPPPEPVPVPQVLTMRQARLVLLGAGKLAAVNAAISALPSPMKEAALIEWEYSSEVQRHNGFVAQIGPVLGMDADALDELFVAAAAL